SAGPSSYEDEDICSGSVIDQRKANSAENDPKSSCRFNKRWRENLLSCCWKKTETGGHQEQRTKKSFSSGSAEENKILVLGPNGAGKTTLIKMKRTPPESSNSDSTQEVGINDMVKKSDKVSHVVEILELENMEDFVAERNIAIQNSKGFLLLFALDDMQSFHEAIEIWDVIHTVRDDQFPIVLVGNKADLIDQREVSRENIDDIIRGRPARYVEASAALNENVSEAFTTLLQLSHDLRLNKPFED
ncbi:ras-related protein R-Ras, partial [Nephila pilipes]